MDELHIRETLAYVLRIVREAGAVTGAKAAFSRVPVTARGDAPRRNLARLVFVYHFLSIILFGV